MRQARISYGPQEVSSCLLALATEMNDETTNDYNRKDKPKGLQKSATSQNQV